MRDIWTVFRFTLRDGLRKKAFIAVTVIVLVLIVGVCGVLRLVNIADKSADETPPASDEMEPDKICYFIDGQNLVPGAMEMLTLAGDGTQYVAGQADRFEEYKAEVEGDKKKAIAEVIPGENGLPAIRLYTTDFMSGVSADPVASAVKTSFVSAQLAAAGVSPEVTKIALGEVSVVPVMLGKMDLSGYILGIAITLVMFFAVYYYGYGVAMSVASEKTSRVMETLVVSAKPSRILLGKCLAMGVLGLLQLSLFLIVGALSYSLLLPADFTIGGMTLSLSSFTVSSALLTLLYFVLGYSLYAVMNSVCGATVSRAEDLNAAMMPVMLISLVSFYFAYFVTLFSPSEAVKRIVTYVPFTSAFVMPFRLLNDTVPPVDIAISIALLAVTILIIAVASVRIYSASVLHYGERLKMKDLFRIKS